MPLTAAPAPKQLPVVDLPTEIVLLTHPEQNPTRDTPFADAATVPFDPRVKPVSRANAWWLAEASWVAYWHAAADIKQAYEPAGLDAELISVDSTDFTIATNGGLAIVAFRGTQPDDWPTCSPMARGFPSRGTSVMSIRASRKPLRSHGRC
jgi:hypothetical protein